MGALQWGVRVRTSEATLEISLELSPVQPSYIIPGTMPEQCSIALYRDICTSMSIAALFARARKKSQPKCPSTDTLVTTIWNI